MAVTDFLFGGTPPPSVDTFSATTTNIPDWWSTYVKGQIAKASSIAAEPYQGYTGPRIAQLTPDQQSAYDLTRQNLGNYQPNLTQANDLFTQSGDANSFEAAQPYINSALGKSATGAAQPYLDKASGSFPDAANDYMSPYTTAVTDRIAELGNRNLTEKILPSIQDQFIAAGQPGSTRASEFTSRAVRDTSNEIAGQQAQALEQGYQTAGNLYNADASRFANLGQTAGNLTGGEQTNIANLGALSGQLTSDTAARRLAAGEQLGSLAQTQQSLGLRDAAALQAVGQEQQNTDQKNLDLAYQNFAEERDYPRENIRFLNEAIRGTSPPTSTTTQGTQPASSVGASPLAQVAGAGLSAAAISNLLKARGGSVKFAEGGYAGGALSGSDEAAYIDVPAQPNGIEDLIARYVMQNEAANEKYKDVSPRLEISAPEALMLRAMIKRGALSGAMTNRDVELANGARYAR